MSKRLVTLLMIFFLSACETSYQRKLACAQIKKHQIPHGEFCRVDLENMECQCKLFDTNNWDPLSELYIEELQYCHGITGHRDEFIATSVRPNVKALARIRRNLCE